MPLDPNIKVVFFDGVCGLCNGFVRFLIRRDKQGFLKFAPLQGKTAAEYLHIKSEYPGDTVVFYTGGKIYTESDAVLEIVSCLGFPWSGLRIFMYLPVKFRNMIYRLIAGNRYKWFGKYDSCRLPTKEEAERFLY